MCRSLHIALLVALASGCVARRSEPVAARAGYPSYEGDVDIDPVARHISARWRIAYVRTPATMDSATLLLNKGFAISHVVGTNVRSVDVRTQDGDAVIIVRFAAGVPADAPMRIEVEYAGTPEFGTDSINGMDARWVELGLDSYWHPVFADYAQRISTRVRLGLPPGWVVAASGSTKREGNTVILTSTLPLIDIAFSASPRLSFRTNVTSGARHATPTRVYFSGAEPRGVDSVLSTIASCADYLNARYGRVGDSLPDIRMVIAPRNGPGYARKNYIVITTSADMTPVSMQRFVCHELAHYWSSGAISNGPENWLNESFAEFVSGRFVQSVGDSSAYASIVQRWEQGSSNAGPIWSPAGTRRPTARAAYNKAPLLLYRLEKRIGTDAMDRILVRYMTERMQTTSALLAMIAQVAGADAAAWVRDELGR